MAERNGQRIRGLLFDKDGTLFDFERTWRGVIAEVLAGLAPSPAALKEMAAVGGYDTDTGQFQPGAPVVAAATREIAELWAPWRPDLGADGLEDAMERIALGALVDPAQLSPASSDLPALLARLGARHRLGVATNDSEAAANHQLSAAGVAGAFRFVAGYDSVPRPKPAPDMILAFADAVGLSPAEVAMIGDSVHDLQAARTAGVGLAVGVLTGPAGAADLAPLADSVIPSIDDLPGLLEPRH